MIKKTILLIWVILSLNGCTKDDLCPEETQTTPLLIFTFKNVLNPLLAKTVTNLTIETDEETPVVYVTNISTDSIGVPLKTGADSVRYRFIQNKGETNEIIDIYEFNYERTDVYVNRACGFKTTYQDLNARKEDDGIVNWILNLNILKTTVEDETEAHIIILH
jgi:hypothetical protein